MLPEKYIKAIICIKRNNVIETLSRLIHNNENSATTYNIKTYLEGYKQASERMLDNNIVTSEAAWDLIKPYTELITDIFFKGFVDSLTCIWGILKWEEDRKYRDEESNIEEILSLPVKTIKESFEEKVIKNMTINEKEKFADYLKNNRQLI